MKATIEECHQQVVDTEPKETISYTIRAAMAVGLGLVAIAYAIRDIAIALRQAKQEAKS